MPPKRKRSTKKAPAKKTQRTDALDLVETMARLQFGPADIAIATELPASDPDVATAYQRGRLKGETDVRKMLMQMAVNGSAPAQKMVLDLIAANRHDRPDGEPAGHTEDVAAALAHLAPLDLAPDGTPLAELCRLAALRIIELAGRLAPETP